MSACGPALAQTASGGFWLALATAHLINEQHPGDQLRHPLVDVPVDHLHTRKAGTASMSEDIWFVQSQRWVQIKALWDLCAG